MLEVQNKIRPLATEMRKNANNQWFKKDSTNKPNFLGVSHPQMIPLIKEYKNLSLQDLKILITSPYHEERMLGIKILNKQFQSHKKNPEKQQEIFDFAFALREYYNQWDLIDTISVHLLGQGLGNPQNSYFQTLYNSKNWIDIRILIVSQIYHIKKQENLEVALIVSEYFFKNEEDLIKKAVGWLLKECYNYFEEPIKQEVKEFILSKQTEMFKLTFRIACEKFR